MNEMSREEKYEYESKLSICEQEIHLAGMALNARKLLDMGYSGHGMNSYEWQASQVVEKLENALRLAKDLPLYSRKR